MERFSTDERTGDLLLCECGLLKSWHGEMVPAYFGAERFGDLEPFEKRRGCAGFKARSDQSFGTEYGSYWKGRLL